ncbi:MAG: hypothetical protein ACE5ER_08355 [Nitrospinaceae bacterium]
MSSQGNLKIRKGQIEQFLKKEFEGAFRGAGRISIRKRQRFMNRVSKKVSKRFGKDVLCLVNFSRQGFQVLASPSQSVPTDKGRLYHSMVHGQVLYTSHCVDRFSERTQTTDNCILALDSCLQEALLTFGRHPGHIVCREGVFAFEIEDERLIIKTFINFEMLSDKQVRDFYGWDVMSSLARDMVAGDLQDSDIILQNELPDLVPKQGL